MTPVAVQGDIETGPAVVSIPPDPTQEVSVDTLGTTSRLHGGASMHQRATKRTCDTDDRRQLKHNDGVGALEAQVERSAVVSVDDPAVPGHQLGLEAFPLVPQ